MNRRRAQHDRDSSASTGANRLRFDASESARGHSARGGFRAARLRVYILLFALAGVLIAMRLAGDPRSWLWLTEAGKQNSSQPLQLREIRPQPGTGQAIDTGQQDGTPNPTDESNADNSTAGETPALENFDFDERGNLSDVEFDFWNRLIRRLDRVSQANLFRLAFDTADDFQYPTAASIANLVERIETYCRQYTAELLAQVGYLDQARPETRQYAYDLMFAWQQHWREQVEPVLQQLATGQAPAEAAAILRPVLDAVAQGLVTDDTQMPDANDHLFFTRLLQRREQLGKSDFEQVQSVTHLQLASQPPAYRGKLVEFSGTIRAARQLPSRDDAGHRFTEIWVQPHDGATIPFCVLSTDWPQSLPELGAPLQPLNVPAEFIGFFFKNRSYLSSQGQIQFCPTLLSVNLQLTGAAVGPSQPAPSGWWIAILVAIGALIALGVAFWVYRSSLSVRKQEPGGDDAQRTLAELAADPTIESPGEKLAKWNPSERETD